MTDAARVPEKRLVPGPLVRFRPSASAAAVVPLAGVAVRVEDLSRCRTTVWLDRLQEVLLVGALTLAPLPLGGARVWAWTVLEMLVGLAVAVWLVRLAIGGGPSPVRAASAGAAPAAAAGLGAVGVFGAGLVTLVTLQMVPLPAWLVAAASPHVAALHEAAHEAAGLPAPAWMTFSIDPHATRVALWQWLMYGACFLLVLNHVRTRRQALRLATALVAIGVLEAAYGIYERFQSPAPHIFWMIREHHLDSVTGTFINRNHFATFLAGPLILALVGVVRPYV